MELLSEWGRKVSLSLISRLAAFKSPHCCIHILCWLTLLTLIPFSSGRHSRPAPTRLCETGLGWACLLTLSQNPFNCWARDAPRSQVGNIKQEGATNNLITCGKKPWLHLFWRTETTSCCFQLVSVATVSKAAGAPSSHCSMKHALIIIFNNNKTPCSCCRNKFLLLPLTISAPASFQLGSNCRHQHAASWDGGEILSTTGGMFLLGAVLYEMESCKSVKTHWSGALRLHSQRKGKG